MSSFTAFAFSHDVFESTGNKMPSLGEGFGRAGRLFFVLQRSLWSGQSVYWHSREQ